MKRKIYGLILFAALALTCAFTLPTKAQAASESDLTIGWIEEYDGYGIIACDKSARGELTIPTTYLGEPVTCIFPCAFMECTKLTSVTIPDTITSIKECAFTGCTNLTGLWVDKNNPNYSSDNQGVLFDKNKKKLLQAPGKLSGDYVISDSVTSISEFAFCQCANLISVTIPDTVKSIGVGAFGECNKIKTVIISKRISCVSDAVFAGCANLTDVSIPEGVESIGEGAFSDCSRLTAVIIPDSVTQIKDSAFSGCTDLKKSSYPKI